MDPKGKLAFVTGAAGGIGAGIARALGHAGARVVISDINAEALRATKDRLARDGVVTATRILDVADLQSWEATIESVVAELGPIHILCNNAGVASGGPIADMDPDVWDRLMAINVNGVFYGVRTFVRHAQAHAEGAHIVNTGSIYGVFSGKGVAPYVTSKFAVVGLSEALRFDLEPDGIGVSVLCPGLVDTGFRLNSQRVLRPGQASQTTGGNKGRMSPDPIGEMVVEAIRENRFYVITHPEYREIVEARHQVMLRDFRAGAQPGYKEDPADIGDHWLRLDASAR
jgi:NAD(P)-dependent dehydrogenase (short-subunit alcohol dehydrogenase family)